MRMDKGIFNAFYKKFLSLLPEPSKKHTCLGLDIGSFSVKLVKLEAQNNIYKVSDLGFAKIKDGDIKAAIKSLLDKTDLRGREVNIGLSGKQVLLRCVLLPDMDEASLRSSMKYEAAKHIPFPIDEVIVDFCILRHNLEDNKMLVLIVAAKKDFVEARLKLLADLGLTPSLLDIDSLAAVNVFNLRREDKGQDRGMSAVLNIGSCLSNLSILEGDLLKFSRDILFGGKDITQKISTKLGIAFESAEKMKISPAASNEALNAIEASLLDLVNELRLSFDYYESQTGKGVDCVYLSGGTSALHRIDRFMQEAMNIPFKRWNPFRGIEFGEDIDKGLVENSAQYFAVAMGLSLR